MVVRSHTKPGNTPLGNNFATAVLAAGVVDFRYFPVQLLQCSPGLPPRAVIKSFASLANSSFSWLKKALISSSSCTTVRVIVVDHVLILHWSSSSSGGGSNSTRCCSASTWCLPNRSRTRWTRGSSYPSASAIRALDLDVWLIGLGRTARMASHFSLREAMSRQVDLADMKVSDLWHSLRNCMCEGSGGS